MTWENIDSASLINAFSALFGSPSIAPARVYDGVPFVEANRSSLRLRIVCAVRRRWRRLPLSLVTTVPVSGVSDYCSLARSRKRAGRSTFRYSSSKNRQFLQAVFHLASNRFHLQMPKQKQKPACLTACMHDEFDAVRPGLGSRDARRDRQEKLFTLNVLQPANISIYCNVRFFVLLSVWCCLFNSRKLAPFPFLRTVPLGWKIPTGCSSRNGEV